MSPIEEGTNSQKILLQNSIQNESIQINSTQTPMQSQSSSCTETKVAQKHSQSIETHVQHIQTIDRHVENTQSIGTHIQHTSLACVSDQCPLSTKQTASQSWTLGANGKNIRPCICIISTNNNINGNKYNVLPVMKYCQHVIESLGPYMNVSDVSETKIVRKNSQMLITCILDAYQTVYKI